jgi:hypothetical protein
MLQAIGYILIGLSFVGWLLGKICNQPIKQKPQRYLPEPELPDSPATVQSVAPPLPQLEPPGPGLWGGVGLVFGGLMAVANKLYENQPSVADTGNDVIRDAMRNGSTVQDRDNARRYKIWKYRDGMIEATVASNLTWEQLTHEVWPHYDRINSAVGLPVYQWVNQETRTGGVTPEYFRNGGT